MQRRTFIKNSTLTVVSVSAFGALNWNGKSFEGDTATTTDILGPFYRPGAPIRTNLRHSNSSGEPIILKGKIYKEDGKTSVPNALVEIWHCDENQVYDNTSDEYNYRGGQKANSNGEYEFKSILPVPYKADPNNDASWRPAHIHMRISVPNQQDLITQIYFKDGKYVDTDRWSSDPKALNRVLPISSNSSGESEIIFNVIMNKEIPLDEKVYDKITGIYDMGNNNNNLVEYVKSDDLLFFKHNGHIVAAMSYIGNNTFESNNGSLKSTFEIQNDGTVKLELTLPDKTVTGTKFLKYN